MRTTKTFAVLIVAVFSLPLAALSQSSTWTIDPAHSSVQFEVLHLGVSHVHGAFTGVKGTVEYDAGDAAKSAVTATIDTTTVSTGVEARDKDLRSPSFFDIVKFPAMSFKSTSISKNNGKLQMIGDLTLNGVTKSVTLDVDGPAPPQKGMGGKLVSGFSANGVIKRSDFNFGSKYVSPMLGDAVKFTIDVEIDKAP